MFLVSADVATTEEKRNVNKYTPNATAKRDFVAHCKHSVKAGSRVLRYRDRAISFKEARDAGTMYPVRLICGECASRWVAETTD